MKARQNPKPWSRQGRVVLAMQTTPQQPEQPAVFLHLQERRPSLAMQPLELAWIQWCFLLASQAMDFLRPELAPELVCLAKLTSAEVLALLKGRRPVAKLSTTENCPCAWRDPPLRVTAAMLTKSHPSTLVTEMQATSAGEPLSVELLCQPAIWAERLYLPGWTLMTVDLQGSLAVPPSPDHWPLGLRCYHCWARQRVWEPAGAAIVAAVAVAAVGEQLPVRVPSCLMAGVSPHTRPL